MVKNESKFAWILRTKVQIILFAVSIAVVLVLISSAVIISMNESSRRRMVATLVKSSWVYPNCIISLITDEWGNEYVRVASSKSSPPEPFSKRESELDMQMLGDTERFPVWDPGQLKSASANFKITPRSLSAAVASVSGEPDRVLIGRDSSVFGLSCFVVMNSILPTRFENDILVAHSEGTAMSILNSDRMILLDANRLLIQAVVLVVALHAILTLALFSLAGQRRRR